MTTTDKRNTKSARPMLGLRIYRAYLSSYHTQTSLQSIHVSQALQYHPLNARKPQGQTPKINSAAQSTTSHVTTTPTTPILGRRKDRSAQGKLDKSWMENRTGWSTGGGGHPHQAEITFHEQIPGLQAATHLRSDHSATTI